MSCCFGRTRSAASKAPSDRVFPLPYFDNGLVNRKTVLCCLFRFDEVLDPEKLRSSLFKLITLDGWSMLGARLRKNRDKGLEYHVPRVYDQDRPAFLWSNVKYNVKASDHEDGKHLPRASAVPAVIVKSQLLLPLMYASGFPTKLDDYLHADIPQLGIHVVSFTDTTLINITWPHTFTDAVGFGDLMQAWALVLQGREDEVRPLYDLASDRLGSFGLSPSEPYKNKKRILSMLQLTLYGARMAYDTIRHRGEEDRIVCMPASTLKKLHQEATQELIDSHTSEKPPFLSEGDVLLAWWAKVTARQYRPTSRRTFALGQVFGHRSFHKQELTPSEYSHLGNVVFLVSAYFQIRDVFNLSLGEIAMKVRQALIDLQSRDQLDALAALHRERKDKYGLELVSGDAMMQLVTLTNWHKGRLYEIDFSGALVRESGVNVSYSTQQEEKPRPVRKAPLHPSLVHCHSWFDYWMALRNHATVTGRDAQGNYWIAATLQKDAWTVIKEGVAEYGDSSTNTSVYQELPPIKLEG